MSLGQYTILIADDDATSRLILESILVQWGYSVASFSDGASALAALEYDPTFSVAILDWVMPGKTGVEICRHFKEKASFDTYLILLTSKYGLDDLIEGFDAGAHDYMQKPCDPEELIARVRAGIRLFEMQKQLQNYADNMEQLAQARAEQLLHAERLTTLGFLSAGMAHEINNPLSFIMGNCRFLADCWPGLKSLIEQAREAGIQNSQADLFYHEFEPSMESISNGSIRIKKIVDSLKMYARKESSERHLCSLGMIIEQALQLCSHRVKEKTLVEFSEPFECMIYGDMQQLEQVFVNLIVNACDAMEDQDCGTITIVYELLEDYVRVTLTDSGPGFSDLSLNNIFVPFFTTKEIGKGTGLGLSICEGIVSDHGGEIRAYNGSVQGACFEILLPLLKRDSI